MLHTSERFEKFLKSGNYRVRIKNPENFFCQFFFLIHLQAFFVKQTYLKTDSFYKLPYRPYCLIGPKNGRGRSCFFLICSVEGCTPITMPKLARETALIDLAAQCNNFHLNNFPSPKKS